MKLTAHFALAEFERSATAQRLGIDNRVPDMYIPSLRNLCQQVLEPLRLWAGQPVVISSGYRCQALNTAIYQGTTPNTRSQHLRGEAADIMAPTHDAKGQRLSERQSQALLRQWFAWVMDNTTFDQLILERRDVSSHHCWMHVSCRPDITRNRQQVIRNLVKYPSTPPPA